MSATIIRGNALDLPLADASVDLVVTSPPYFGLRSYQDGGAHYSGQIGAEPTPAEFVDALIAATREMVRVLKPSGSIWVNLGDKYAGSRMDGSNDNGSAGTLVTKHRAIPLGQSQGQKASSGGVATKSLIGIPWRYALRCIDELGLILRAEVIWSKPNGLPESVTDRVRRSHEVWFHFTKEPRYYSAVDEIREGYSERVQDRQKYAGRTVNTGAYSTGSGRMDGTAQAGPLGFNGDGGNPLGKLPGSVWTIPTQPLKVPPELGIDHFAAFPMEWPRRIIAGWSPAGVCTACGQGRRPVTSVTHTGTRKDRSTSWIAGSANLRGDMTVDRVKNIGARTSITGYACDCAEPTAPTTPGVVLDPFGGTGTTALVADVMGRLGISVDMSADYCRLAEWRINDPKQRERAARGPKPAAKPKPPEKVAEVEFIHPDQLDLFEDGAA